MTVNIYQSHKSSKSSNYHINFLYQYQVGKIFILTIHLRPHLLQNQLILKGYWLSSPIHLKSVGQFAWIKRNLSQFKQIDNLCDPSVRILCGSFRCICPLDSQLYTTISRVFPRTRPNKLNLNRLALIVQPIVIALVCIHNEAH